MSEFSLFPIESALTKRRPPTAAAAFERATTVFVDVAETPTRAEVSRGGFAVGEIAVNNDLIASFLDDLVVVQTKVVTQTIVPGTAVARGTAVDVVLASTGNLPVRVIPGVHAQFAELTMSQLHAQFSDNSVVRDLVRRRTNPDDLTPTEQESLTAVMQANNVAIDADNTVGSAFTALQAAFTFQG